jgi:hypothetical protein
MRARYAHHDVVLAIPREPAPPMVDNALAMARAAAFASLGQVDERAFARQAAVRTGAVPLELAPWPSTPVGRVKLIRRGQTDLVVTDGMSDPWDPSLHASPPGFRFACELAIEVPSLGEGMMPAAWIAPLLLWISNWLIAQKFDLRARMRAHTCLTLGALPIPGLESWKAPNGLHGLLLGIPFAGNQIGAHAVLAREGNETVWLVPMKLLHPKEYAWALEVRDSSRATWLVQSFMQSDRHMSRTDRGPIVGG